jgi:serine/threonine-protein kinase RsbW
VIAISLRPIGRKWGTVSFASTLHLCPVLDLLMADVPARWRAEVRLGLQEALVNAAKHGNKLDPNKTVLVEFYILENEYWWVISDQGSGFSPDCSCTLERTDEKDVHQVHWNQQGTELRLCKQIKSRSKLPLVH